MKRLFLIFVVSCVCFSTLCADDVSVESGTQTDAYSGTMNLIKTTDGTYVLNQDNRFTGTTTVQAGTLKITAGNLISSAGIIVDAGTLELASSATNAMGAQKEVPDITLNAGGTLTNTTSQYHNIKTLVLNGGTLTSTAAGEHGAFLLGGTVHTTANSTISGKDIRVRSIWGTVGSTGLWTVDNGTTLTVSSKVILVEADETSKSTLEKLGEGTLAFTGGEQQLTQGGTLKITNGTVSTNATNLSKNGATDNIGVQLNGGKLQLNDSGNIYSAVNITADSTLELTKAEHYDFFNAIKGTGNLTYQSNVRAVNTLRGDMSGYTGTMTLDATGSIEFFLTLDNAAQNSSTYAIHFADNLGRLTLSADNASDTDFRVGMISGNGIVRHYANSQASNIKLKVGNDTEYTDHNFSGRIYDYAANQVVTVEKVGTNRWTLSGANTHSGGTIVSGGVLEIANANALGTGTLTLNGGSGITPTVGLTLTNPVNVAKDASIYVNVGDLVLSGDVSGSANIAKTGGKNLHFGGSLANYSGTLSSTNAAGWFIFRDKATDGTKTNVKVGNVAFITADGTPFQFEMFTADGEVRPSNSSAEGKLVTLTVGGDTEYAEHTSTALYNNGSRTMALEKTGSNTWELTNTGNSYTGGTKISGGVLEIAGKVLGSGTVTLNGGTLRTLTNDVTLPNAMTATADSRIDVAAGKTLTLTQNITGGKTVELTGGTLSVPNMNNTTSWKLNGGTLQVLKGGTNTGGIDVAAASTLDMTSSEDYNLNGALTGSAPLTLSTSNNSRVVFRLKGDSSSYTGTVTVAATTNETFFTLESGAKNFSNAAIDLGDKTRFYYVAASTDDVFQVGMLTGTANTLTQAHNDSTTGTVKLQVGNDTEYTNHTFNGNLQNRTDKKILAIEKVGTNTWTLSGTNTYTGGTTVSGGVLEATNLSALGKGTLTLNGGTLQLNDSGNIGNAVNITADSTLELTKVASYYFEKAITGTGNLTYQSNVRAVNTLRGDMSGYTGTMTLDATGSDEFFLTLDNAAQNSSTYAIHFADNLGRLALYADNASDTDFRVGMISGNGIVRHYANAQASSINLQVGNDTDYTNHDFSGQIFNYTTNQIVAVEKVGTNTWTLSGTNTYTGGTTVSGGVLEIANANALGTGTLTLNGGTLQLSSEIDKSIGMVMAADSTIDLNANADFWLRGSMTGSKDLRITSDGEQGVLHLEGNSSSYTGKITISGGELKITNLAAAGSGPIQIDENGTFSIEINAVSEYNKTITGSGTLQTSGPYKFTMTGDFSGFTGTYKALNSAVVLNTNSDTSGMVVDNSSSTQFCFPDKGLPVDATVGMIVGSGIVRPSNAGTGNDVVLAVGNDTEYTNHTFDGVLQDQYDVNKGMFYLGVQKVGSNTWTLSKTNTYTGATTVSEGVLELTSTGKITQSTVTVDGGTLKNAGTITNRVTVNDGGTYLSDGGTLTNGLTLNAGGILEGGYTGNVTLTSGSILKFDLDDLKTMNIPSAGISDGVIAMLDVDDVGAIIDQTFQLFQTDADILDNLTFQGPSGAYWIGSYADGWVSVLAGDPSKLPEPSSLWLLLGMLGMYFRRK